jgi:hypothetical protein
MSLLRISIGSLAWPALRYLVDAFDNNKPRVCRAHARALFEQPIRLGIPQRFLYSQQFDRTSSARAGSTLKLTKWFTPLAERMGAYFGNSLNVFFSHKSCQT